MALEPKLCPFCRSDKIMVEGSETRIAAVCQKCLARGPEVEASKGRDKAIEAWNLRTLYFSQPERKK